MLLSLFLSRVYYTPFRRNTGVILLRKNRLKNAILNKEKKRKKEQNEIPHYRRKNKMKVQVAIARKVLTAVWYVMHDNVAYRDFTPDIAPAE